MPIFTKRAQIPFYKYIGIFAEKYLVAIYTQEYTVEEWIQYLKIIEGFIHVQGDT